MFDDLPSNKSWIDVLPDVQGKIGLTPLSEAHKSIVVVGGEGRVAYVTISGSAAPGASDVDKRFRRQLGSSRHHSSHFIFGR